MPLDVAQRTLGRPGQVLALWAQVNEAANVAQVERDLASVLAGRADLLTQQAAARFAADELAALGASSLLGAAVAAVIGALVVVFRLS